MTGDKTAARGEETRGTSLCWNCQSEVNGVFFCVNCVKVQPVSHESDYFSVFGMPRRLNIDQAALEVKFHELSRKLHPDFYQGKSEREKVLSLDNSAVINTAYRILKEPLRRMEYLVKLEEGASKEIQRKAPQDLLGEMLDLQETLAEYKSVKGRASNSEQADDLRQSLADAQRRLQSRLSKDGGRAVALFDKWDALLSIGGTTEQKKAVLAEMRDILSNRAYLDRVMNDIAEELG